MPPPHHKTHYRAKSIMGHLRQIHVTYGYQVGYENPGGTRYDCLYREAPPERGILFRLQVNERVGISLDEVSKRVGKSVICVCERTQKS